MPSCNASMSCELLLTCTDSVPIDDALLAISAVFVPMLPVLVLMLPVLASIALSCNSCCASISVLV